MSSNDLLILGGLVLYAALTITSFVLQAKKNKTEREEINKMLSDIHDLERKRKFVQEERQSFIKALEEGMEEE